MENKKLLGYMTFLPVRLAFLQNSWGLAIGLRNKLGHSIARVQLCATFANILPAGKEDLAGFCNSWCGTGLGWSAGT